MSLRTAIFSTLDWARATRNGNIADARPVAASAALNLRRSILCGFLIAPPYISGFRRQGRELPRHADEHDWLRLLYGSRSRSRTLDTTRNTHPLALRSEEHT